MSLGRDHVCVECDVIATLCVLRGVELSRINLW